MRKKTIKVADDKEYFSACARVLNAIGNMKLTPQEVVAFTGYLMLTSENKTANVLSKRNQEKVCAMVGLHYSNLRSLTTRLIEKGIIAKRGWSEGEIKPFLLPSKETETFEIHIQRNS